jgi:hypothetical protein
MAPEQRLGRLERAVPGGGGYEIFPDVSHGESKIVKNGW